MSRIQQALRRAAESGLDVSWRKPEDRHLAPEAEPALREADRLAVAPVEYQEIALDIPPGSPILPFDGINPRVAEQYRILRTNLIRHASKPKVIAISSACPGDGKTLSAINLAGALSLKAGTNVLLIDADLRQRDVGRKLAIGTRLGLSDVLSGECSASDAIFKVKAYPSLHILSSGRVDANPAELLDSPACRDLIAGFREEFSFVVVDTTPVTALADYSLVEQLVDAVLLVIRPDHTHRPAFQRLLATDVAQKVIGLVINGFEDWFLWHSADTYGYYATKSGQ